MAKYIDAVTAAEKISESLNIPLGDLVDIFAEIPTADVVEVDALIEQIIRRKSEVNDYWQNDVKRYIAMQGYPDIETATDNFLRGYNEAVEDMIAILERDKNDQT